MEKSANQQVLWEIPHVKLVRMEGGSYCLIVEDTEVNDFVEDHLWDDFEYDTTSIEMAGPTLAVYHNCFFPGLVLEPLMEALQRLDPAEVERVYRLNN